jgi:hypothetical protein
MEPRSVSVISPDARIASMSASGLISPAYRNPKLSVYHFRDRSASRQVIATWNTRMVSSDDVLLNVPPSLSVDRLEFGQPAEYTPSTNFLPLYWSIAISLPQTEGTAGM